MDYFYINCERNMIGGHTGPPKYPVGSTRNSPTKGNQSLKCGSTDTSLNLKVKKGARVANKKTVGRCSDWLGYTWRYSDRPHHMHICKIVKKNNWMML